MGKNNRMRRRIKQRDRARQSNIGRRRHQPVGEDRDQTLPPFNLWDTIELIDALAIPGSADPRLSVHGVAILSTFDPALVAKAAQVCLLRRVPAAWNNGWQPAELHRQLRRATNGTGAKLALGLIANDHHGQDTTSLDPRWVAQLNGLGLPVRVDPDWLIHWAEGAPTDAAAMVTLLIELVHAVASLGPIAVLIPPPGSAPTPTATADLGTPLDDSMLERVRALLAKAESTTFEAEAEAFTAKAQELMARYSIDAAMLSARTTNSDQPVTIRIPIDDPYADAKSLLCQEVALHSRARSVWHQGYAFSSVVGFAPDLAATEILFTSLLVQAQTAMQSAAVKSSAGGRARSRSFRSAFLVAYANRVGERLAEINDHVTTEAQAEIGTALVPVLAARGAAVDDAVRAEFGALITKPVRGGRDPAGWASGRIAADLAKLNLGDLRGQPPTRSPNSLPGPGQP